ncbi:hypothetical protein ID849_16690 [Xenorhabdus sp. 3]|uniref:hypothetical protein n=1 Tax=Xenorhabdus doucetiae TaxID=351671 RepID=UPI0019ABD014|nr:hypothetical protein [Xenorhabdus sp. 3]MBD2786304.1 hypothetical protein [Xenorhabdus sp. 3]
MAALLDLIPIVAISSLILSFFTDKIIFIIHLMSELTGCQPQCVYTDVIKVIAVANMEKATPERSLYVSFNKL